VILTQGGSFGIDIRKDGYAPVQGNGSVPNGNIAVFSPKLNTIANNVASAQGKVVDGNGQPLTGVSILEGNVIVATTDAQGLFSITNVQAGSKQWLVSKSGYLQATVSASMQAGQNLNIGTISLPTQIVSSDPNTPPQTTIATGNIVVKALDSRNNEP
ncbi:carboxypeptidase regulatory-like domain-containing protein, partial [Rhizobium hidalgonense]